VWRGIDYHGTTLTKVDPLDENLEFKQSGLAPILRKRLPDALGQTNRKRKAGEMESGEEGSQSSKNSKRSPAVVFDDTPVTPNPRATMPLWNTGKSRMDRVYSANKIPIYSLHTNNKYNSLFRRMGNESSIDG